MIAEEEIIRIRTTRNYYEILRLSKDATDSEIKSQYRKLALLLHPDKCSIEGSEETFKAVNAAYSCLSDVNLRKSYDKTGSEDNYDNFSRFDRSDEIFEMFFRRHFDHSNAESDDWEFDGDADEFAFWENYFSTGSSRRRFGTRKSEADWSSANQAANIKVNCIGCNKHMPSLDCRFDMEPFYQNIRGCRKCSKQIENLKNDFLRYRPELAVTSNEIIFAIKKRKGNKERLKAALRRDKGWNIVEINEEIICRNLSENIGFTTASVEI